jgi:hypothetical protein
MNAAPQTTSPYAGALPTNGMHDAIDTSPASVRRMEHLASADADSALDDDALEDAIQRAGHAMQRHYWAYEQSSSKESLDLARRFSQVMCKLIAKRTPGKVKRMEVERGLT